uniref:G-protein coupled receptors family 1 profile domain-containing protein n=1 Tax=Strigamia maritima TaxID=126957 RepID=T1IVC4_STRMM
MKNITHCEKLDSSNTTVILVVIVDVIIAVIAIFGNSVVIWSVIRFPNLRTNTNIFVVSLAVADLLVGICIPYYVLFYFHISWTCERTPCLLRYFTVLFPTISSMFSNIGAAVERYVAIIHPLSYHRIMNTGWAVKSIVIGWAYVGIVSALPLMGVNVWEADLQIECVHKCKECDLRYIVKPIYTLLAVSFHVFFTLIITLGLYYCIFREAWRHLKNIPPVGVNAIIPSLKRETKTSRMMGLVLGVCLLGLTPYLIAIMYPIIKLEEGDNNSWIVYKRWAVCFYLGKSSVNPLIYGWKNRDFREAFFRLLKIDRNKEFYSRSDANQTHRTSMPMFTITN